MKRQKWPARRWKIQVYAYIGVVFGGSTDRHTWQSHGVSGTYCFGPKAAANGLGAATELVGKLEAESPETGPKQEHTMTSHPPQESS